MKKTLMLQLTASARIEWIQKVRNTTSELITLYYEALNTVDVADLLETVIKAQGKTELLILYFGHEEKEVKNYKVDLLCTADNDNKNSHIVNFLSSLSKKLYRYYENVEYDKLKNLKTIRDKRYSEMQDHVLSYDYEEYTDEYGIMRETPVPILDEEYQGSLDEIDEQITNLVKVSKDINSDLLMLRNIIRTYLKIEWNKAKTGI